MFGLVSFHYGLCLLVVLSVMIQMIQGLLIYLGNFIGAFIFIYACVWAGSKVQGMFKRA
jgi:formate/nitrite transporter FocA (FNT family)